MKIYTTTISCSIVTNLEDINVFVFIFIHTYIYIYIYMSEKAMAPHSSTLAWKIPRTEEPGGLPSMGSLRVGYD